MQFYARVGHAKEEIRRPLPEIYAKSIKVLRLWTNK
jgi:hypothetical protein